MSAATEPDYGYQFDPPARSDHPGYRRLSLWLSAVPTQRHYDPESVQCVAVSSDGDTQTLEIQHPWPFGRTYRICAGRVVLNDRKGKKVEAFTFGADLQVESGAVATACALDSPAPIFALLDPDSLSCRFAAEVEVQLAERRAAWDSQAAHADFSRRLAALAPLALYRASLTSVDRHLQPLLSHDRLAHEVARFIARERAEYADLSQAPAFDTALEDLLSTLPAQPA